MRLSAKMIPPSLGNLSIDLLTDWRLPNPKSKIQNPKSYNPRRHGEPHIDDHQAGLSPKRKFRKNHQPSGGRRLHRPGPQENRALAKASRGFLRRPSRKAVLSGSREVHDLR